MTLEDQFQYLVGGYYGVQMMDEYDLKIYVLKDIENYIDSFVSNNLIEGFDYNMEAQCICDRLSDRIKLQDALLVLHKIDAPLALILLVKAKLKLLGRKDNF